MKDRVFAALIVLALVLLGWPALPGEALAGSGQGAQAGRHHHAGPHHAGLHHGDCAEEPCGENAANPCCGMLGFACTALPWLLSEVSGGKPFWFTLAAPCRPQDSAPPGLIPQAEPPPPKA